MFLASNFLNFIFILLGTPLGSSGFNLSKIYIEQLPIKLTKKEIEKDIEKQVDLIFELNKKVIDENKDFIQKLNEFNPICY